MATIQPKICTGKNGQEFTIRMAQPEDAAVLLAYGRRIASEPELTVLEPDELPATEEKERQWIQDHLDHPGKIVLVAESLGTVLGALSSENGAHRRTAHRGSFGIALVKEWRGRGVGMALLEALLEWATTNPIIEKVSLDVSPTNHGALRLHKRLGFIEEGLRLKELKFGPGRCGDGLAMQRFVK